MPMTLEIDTFAAGDAEEPSFLDDAEVTGPTAGDPADETTSPEGTDGKDRGDDADDENLKLVAGSAAVGLGVLALVGSGVLLLRRRLS